MQTKQYIPYKIKSGDTLKSLAERIGLNSYKQLLNFHNEVSQDTKSKIKAEVIKGSVLYVPEENEVAILNANYIEDVEKTKAILNFSLDFSKLNNYYTVEIEKVKTSGTQKTKNTINYEVEIKWVEEYEGYQIIEINKSSFYINKVKPSTKMEQLAFECSKAYYPMQLGINFKKRKIIVFNYDEIITRWNVIKENLKLVYVGDFVNKYIASLEKNLTQCNMNEVMGNDTFIKAFFSPYFKRQIQEKIEFTELYTKDKVKYLIEQSLDEEEITGTQFQLNQSGTIDDNRNFRDIKLIKNTPNQLPLPKLSGKINNSFQLKNGNCIPIKIQSIYNINYTKSLIKKSTINIELK